MQGEILAPLDDRPVGELTVHELKSVIRQTMIDMAEDVGLSVDTAEDKKEARADFLHLRTIRRAFDATSSTVGRTIVSSVVIGILGLIAWLFKVHIVTK